MIKWTYKQVGEDKGEWCCCVRRWKTRWVFNLINVLCTIQAIIKVVLTQRGRKPDTGASASGSVSGGCGTSSSSSSSWSTSFFFVGRLARELVCTPRRRMVRYRRSDGSWRDSLGTTRRSFKKLAMYVAMHHVRRRERPVSIPKFKYVNGSKKQVKNNCVEHLERTRNG